MNIKQAISEIPPVETETKATNDQATNMQNVKYSNQFITVSMFNKNTSFKWLLFQPLLNQTL